MNILTHTYNCKMSPDENTKYLQQTMKRNSIGKLAGAKRHSRSQMGMPIFTATHETRA